MKRPVVRGAAVRAIGAGLGLAAMLGASEAGAYCRTATCETQSQAWQVCTPEQLGDCGTPLWWGNQCVGFTLQKDASSQVSLADAEVVFKEAFARWTGADCGNGEHPSVSVEYQGTVECDAQEYNTEKGNANIIMFRDDSWPYGGMTNILALTTVTYTKASGQIYDADMEINSANIEGLTIGDNDVQFDLPSIATHEAGHFLGLAHSKETDATMFADYKFGTTFLRDLSDDDIAGVCAVFPPGKPVSDTCDAEPRHGFSDLCGADQPEPGEGGGCAVRGAGGEGETGSLAALAAALGVLGLAARRRRRG
ncbi:MAG: matrixin family metalloprotease [Polyangiaceae bacterium]